MPLLKDGRLVDDDWQHVPDGEPLPPAGAVLVSLSRWQDEAAHLRGRDGALGVRLANSDPVEALVPDLARLDLIELQFPKFSDGRAYSQARLLRQRFGFQGEIRASGQTLRDQYIFMRRCGFDTIQVAEATAAEGFRASGAAIAETYQPAADADLASILRRRLAAGPEGAAEARLRALESRVGGLPAADLLRRLVLEEFPGRIALVSSFGTESAVLLHMLAAIDRRVPVLFLDTGKLFGETLRYRRDLVARLGLSDVRSLAPPPDALAEEDADGRLWQRDPDRCCALRKVAPLAQGLAPFAAWITGRKRYQGGLRGNLPVLEARDGRIKANPLHDWSRDDIAGYFAVHDLPPHPLVEDGWRSVGCMPCSDRAAPGEGDRDGRWRGLGKTECGIHLDALPRIAARRG